MIVIVYTFLSMASSQSCNIYRDAKEFDTIETEDQLWEYIRNAFTIIFDTVGLFEIVRNLHSYREEFFNTCYNPTINHEDL